MTETRNGIRRVAVVGASSQIGLALLPRLEAAGFQVFRIGRRQRHGDGAATHVFDEAGRNFTPRLSADAVISLAPLPTIGLALQMARALGAWRMIAFGSTGRFSKVDSTSALERDFVDQQIRAEHDFISSCEAAGIAWTLFRPTMIYGADADLNVAFIKSVIRRFGFFVVPWGAKGLRQPVHVEDLADGCIKALGCERSFNRSYNLAGGEVLPFRELVKRVFLAERRRPVLLPVPKALLAWLVRIAVRKPGYAFMREEMVDRLFVDLTADNRAAELDFGYSPRPFTPGRYADGD